MKTNEEIFATANKAIDSAEATSTKWAEAMSKGTLHELASFQAYVALPNLGPANDHDSVRSAAMRLKRKMDEVILAPAQQKKKSAGPEITSP